ncbi:MAG: hypothetical protein ACHQUC_10625, partial [Chlamydiales bacterium]
DIVLFKKTLHDFGEGTRLFNERKFAEASHYFKKVLDLNPNDLAAICYLDRCQHNDQPFANAEDLLIRKLEEK